MSLADELATAIAMRLVPQSSVAQPIDTLLGRAFGRLNDLFKPSDSTKSALESLNNLLLNPTTSEGGASDLAERLVSCLPRERALAAAGLAGGDSARSAEQNWKNSAVEPLASKRDVPDPVSLVRKLVSALDSTGNEGRAVTQLWNLLHEMSADVTTMIAASSSGWTSGEAIKKLREQLEKWIKNIRALNGLPKRTMAVASELDFELKFRFPVRLGVAAVLSWGGAVLYGSKEIVDDVDELLSGAGSNMSLGLRVHSRLQLKYRAGRPFDVVEQDDRVYGLGRSALVVGIPLKEAATRFGGVRDELVALYLARQSLKAVDTVLLETSKRLAEKIAGWSIRDDNTNLTEARIFEIKPVRGAAVGVIQEMYYRSAFNMWIAIFQDLESIGTQLSQILGRNFSKLNFGCEKLYAGTAGDWPEANTAHGGVLSARDIGLNYTIMVTQVDALPGLVLYWNFEIPAAALKLIYDTVRGVINSLANRIRRWVIEALTWVVALVLAIVAVVLLLVAVILAPEIGPVLAALSRLGPAFAPVVQGIRAFQQALSSAAPSWSLISSNDTAATGEVSLRIMPSSDLLPNTLLIGIKIGFLRVTNVPVDAAKHLGAIVQGGFGLAGWACEEPLTGAA